MNCVYVSRVKQVIEAVICQGLSYWRAYRNLPMGGGLATGAGLDLMQ